MPQQATSFVGRAVASPQRAALIVLAGTLATIGGAFVFQYGLGYLPCELCLKERIPYYAAMPLALVVALVPRRIVAHRGLRVGLGLLGLIFVFSAGFGLYHAGVEWHWWPGPAGCSGAGVPGSLADFTAQLSRIGKVVSCTEAAWRFLGLSLAGWNALISLALAGIAFSGARAAH